MVFWHPRGWQIWQVLEQYIRDVQNANGYQEIKTPQVVDMSLWQKSGHADKFSDDMFSLSSDSREYAIKPMNCPCHVQVFNQGLKSYRDLPIRLAEFGSCHRNEPSGTLQGIMRVRGFVQDDAHIFCRDDQIHEEVLDFITVITRVYQDFGFDDIIIKLSTRPEKRVGSDEVWDRAEQALANALDDKALEWEELPGEGAFYGPKIEFSLKDCLTCLAVRHYSGRFLYAGSFGCPVCCGRRLKADPVMLHRAMLGSFERFIGILIEHYAGEFPTWLAPVQAMVLNITDSQSAYVHEVTDALKAAGFVSKTTRVTKKSGLKYASTRYRRFLTCW